MPVIDIDTHFEPGRSWLADHPDLAAQLPEYSVAIATVRAQVGDLLAAVPVEDRPPLEDLLPPGIAAILGQTKVDGYGFEGSAMHTQTDASSRLAWMDRVGIDMANTICMEAASYARYLEDRDLARRAVSVCNTWLADQVDGHRSEEHTSELQSLTNLVCRLLLEKKKKTTNVSMDNKKNNSDNVDEVEVREANRVNSTVT